MKKNNILLLTGILFVILILTNLSIDAKASLWDTKEGREELREGLKECGYDDDEIDDYFKEQGWDDDYTYEDNYDSSSHDSPSLSIGLIICISVLGVLFLKKFQNK
ncbi:MAG: hypothetical protein ABEK36_01530 [Candidatus Aenigmatarchaeota archaeon]